MTEDDARGDELGPWQPLTVDELVAVMPGVNAGWWIAGGWAIDLHLGQLTRPHADLDVLVLRSDLSAFERCLQDWDLHAADPPGRLRRWHLREPLSAHVHDIWCRRTPADPWQLQDMIDDTVEGEWVYRRDPRIRRASHTLRGPASTPQRAVLTPEVQLLYKSTAPRPKDEADFRTVLPALSAAQRDWLHTALGLTTPSHPWRDDLQA